MMRITVYIEDSLHRRARKEAEREGTTLKALVERGLRQVVSDKKRRKLVRQKIVATKVTT